MLTRIRPVCTHRRLIFSITVMFLAAVAAGEALAQEFSDTVIFATNSIELGKNTEVLSGNVVVNDASDGPTLRGGVELSINKNGDFAGDLIADSIVLDKKNDVSGAISCNDGSGVSCSGLSLPVFDAAELPDDTPVVLDPGAADVNVPDGGQVSLDAGSYADITAGDDATIVFTGGVYNIGSVQAGNSAALEFLAPSELRILGTLGMGNNAFIGPGAGSTASASTIEVFVSGANIDASDPGSEPAAAHFNNNATLSAVFFVPNGTLRFKNNAFGAGVFAARDVKVGNNGEFVLSAANAAPTADAQTVYTSGSAAVLITLTGSDPTNESLSFSIASAPSQGSLGAVTATGSATAQVTYTPNTGDDLEDVFTFQVTDPVGNLDLATVDINPVEASPDPPTVTGAVVARDESIEVVSNTEASIVVAGIADVADPNAAGDFSFSIISGPAHGALTPLVPAFSPIFAIIRSAETTYAPDLNFTGSDSFEFEVCGDLNNDGDTLDIGECDIGTVDLTVNDFTPLPPPVAPTAENLTVATPEDTPVEINLTDQNETCAQGDPSCTPDPHPKTLLPGGPNLTVTGFSAPTCALLGEVIGAQIQVQVTNTGPAVIPASTAAAIGFYISTDSVITTSDTLLIGGRENLLSEAPGGLLVGESISDFLFSGASINSDSPTGNVFIGVLADEFDGLDEDNESDNTAAQAIEIPASGTCSTSGEPDLIISSIDHTPEEPIGFGSIFFTASVNNIGDADAAASTLCFAIGALDEDCNDAAALFAVPILTAGAIHNETRTEDIAVGAYQNIAVADIDNVVAEADETNNMATDTYAVAAASTILTATINTLPTAGTLFGATLASFGATVAITTAPTDLLSTSVLYTPDPLPVGAEEGIDFFEYTLINTSTGLSSVVARVDLTITQIIDPCTSVGRDTGCAPGQ